MSKASDLARLVTSGSTAIHGEAGVTSSGSTGATTNLQQGLCKHWTRVTDGDTVADSFNQSSITDNSASDCTYNINNDMANANYSNSFLATYDNNTNPFRTLGYFGSAPTASAFRTHGFYDTTMATNDMTISTVATFGDLA